MRNLIYIFTFILFMYSCANPVAPSGGVKDTEAPIVKLVQPKNGITNYQGNKIEFLFDEYIFFSSGLDKLLITPPMPSKPDIFVKGKKLIIKLPENLAQNTTYNISFLGAISDYNEGNQLNILKYVFSTGDYIDSASISGVVKNAFDNKKLENITVGLYPIEDTAILLKSKPLYLSQTDNLGNFKIENVKEAEYKIAAIEDKNLNFLFDQQNERISLVSNPIFITNNTVLEQEISLFTNESKALVKDYKILNNNSLYFNFNKEIETISLDVAPYFNEDVVRMSAFNDSLFYHWSTDSLKAATFTFKLNDDGLDTIEVNYSKNKRDSIISLASDYINQGKALTIISPLLIDDIDESQIEIRDSTGTLLDFTYLIDDNKLLISSNFKEFNEYSILIKANSIFYFNNSNNKQEFNYEFVCIEKYYKSKLILSLNTSLNSNLMLELLNKNENKLQQFNITNQSKFVINDLDEGIYYLRIYADFNKNEKWNTGSFQNNYEAEPCLFFSPAIEIKSNWDKEFTINF